MNTFRFSAIGLAAAALGLGLAACSDSPTSAGADFVSDSTVTADVAVSAGDEIASSVSTLSANEAAASLDVGAGGGGTGAPAYALNVSRSRTCYDASGAVVDGCKPLSSVRKIVTHAESSGSRSVSNETEGGNTVTWSGSASRVSDDTLLRNFDTGTPPSETSRTHAGLTVGADTTAFASAQTTRDMSEAFTDRIVGVTWNVPRSSNPFPISGTIYRSDTVHVAVTRGTTTKTRDTTRNVEVDFPADAQGNVVMKVNDKTCNLNLVTHAVSGCH